MALGHKEDYQFHKENAQFFDYKSATPQINSKTGC